MLANFGIGTLAFDATRAQNESVRMPGILELSVLMPPTCGGLSHVQSGLHAQDSPSWSRQ
jgi:hypothetical protein